MTAIYALVVAAGRGTRFGGAVPKQYLPLGGRSLLAYSLAAFARHPRIRGVLTAIRPEDRLLFERAAAGGGRARAAGFGAARARGAGGPSPRSRADPRRRAAVSRPPADRPGHRRARPRACGNPGRARWRYDQARRGREGAGDA